MSFWEYENENYCHPKNTRNKNRNSGNMNERKRELFQRKIRNIKADFYFHLARSAVINFVSRNPQLQPISIVFFLCILGFYDYSILLVKF